MNATAPDSISKSALQQLNDEWVRIALTIIFGYLVIGIFQDGTPVGRDWFRFWLPYTEYFSRNSPTYGVLWQLGAATLPIYDPSTFLFDPVFVLLLKITPFPLNIKLYALLIWALGLFSAERLLFRIGVENAIRFTAAIAFAFGGLGICVVIEQFIPFYFILPAAAFAFLLVCEKNDLARRLLFSTSLYYLGYTSVPGVFLLTAVGSFWALTHNRERAILCRGLLYASVGLAFPYTALIYSKLQAAAPESYLAQWPFHPARVVSFFLPEFISMGAKTMYWLNNTYGSEGFGEPYFRTIALPYFSLAGIWLVFFKEVRLALKNRVALRFLALGIVAGLCGMVGLLPADWHPFLMRIPLFFGRYHEKYLLLSVPVFLASSAYLFSKASLKQRVRSVAWHFCFITASFGTAAWFYPPLLTTFRSFTPAVYAIIFIQLGVTLAAALLRPSWKYAMPVCFTISAFAYLPIGIANIRSGVRSLEQYMASAEVISEGDFLRAYGKLLERQFVFIHPDASMGTCLSNDKSGSNISKCGRYINGSWLGFMSYMAQGGYTSFFGLRNVHDADPNDYVVNIKPRYVIIAKTTDSATFCNHLIKTKPSIIGCALVSSPTGYEGELRVLEIKHMNEIAVLSDGDPYKIDLAIKARYAQVRLPFMLPPGGTVTIDGQAVPTTLDTFGIIVPLTGADKSKGYSEHKITIEYHGRVVKVAFVLALSLALFSIAFELVFKKRLKALTQAP